MDQNAPLCVIYERYVQKFDRCTRKILGELNCMSDSLLTLFGGLSILLTICQGDLRALGLALQVLHERLLLMPWKSLVAFL